MQAFNLLIEFDDNLNAKLLPIDLGQLAQLQATGTHVATLATEDCLVEDLRCQTCSSGINITIHLVKEAAKEGLELTLAPSVEANIIVKEEFHYQSSDEDEIIFPVRKSRKRKKNETSPAREKPQKRLKEKSKPLLEHVECIDVKREVKHESFPELAEDDETFDQGGFESSDNDSEEADRIDFEPTTVEDYDRLYDQEKRKPRSYPYYKKLALRDGTFLHCYKKSRMGAFVLSDFDIRSRICDICSMDFTQAGNVAIQSLLNHRRYSHFCNKFDIEYTCRACNLEFENADRLVRHTFVCKQRSVLKMDKPAPVRAKPNKRGKLEEYAEVFKLIETKAKKFPYFESVEAKDGTVLHFMQSKYASMLFMSIVDLRSLTCDICATKFQRMANFINHRKSHFLDPDDDKTCAACKRQFAETNSLMRHTLICKAKDLVSPSSAVSEVEYENVYKAIEFKRKQYPYYELVKADDGTELHFYKTDKDRRLFMSVIDIRSLTCDICSARFKFMANFTVHRQKHFFDSSDDKACRACKRRFNEVTALQRHTLVCKEKDSLGQGGGTATTVKSTAAPVVVKVEDLDVKPPTKKSHGGWNKMRRFDDDDELENLYWDMKHRKKDLPFYLMHSLTDGRVMHIYQETAASTLYISDFDLRSAICEICSKKFDNVVGMLVHRRGHFFERDNVQCVACSTEFKSDKKALFHSLTCKMKNNIKALTCKYNCGATFPSYLQQRRHELAAHGWARTNKEKWLCHICSQECANYWGLKNHMRREHKIDTYSCHHCEKQLANRQSLKSHLINTHFRHLATFSCEVCGMRFAFANQHANHMEKHSSIKKPKVNCKICFKELNKETLKTHMRIVHSDQDPRPRIYCEVCNKMFFSPSSLDYHRRSHLPPDEWEFKCQYCTKAFYSKSKWVIHLKRHTGNTEHVCSYCGKGFATKQYLKDHQNLHTVSRGALLLLITRL